MSLIPKDIYDLALLQEEVQVKVQLERVPALKRSLSKAKKRANNKLPPEQQDARRFHFSTEKTEEAGIVILTVSLNAPPEVGYEVIAA